MLTSLSSVISHSVFNILKSLLTIHLLALPIELVVV
jgi:hypothetical protein